MQKIYAKTLKDHTYKHVMMTIVRLFKNIQYNSKYKTNPGTSSSCYMLVNHSLAGLSVETFAEFIGLSIKPFTGLTGLSVELFTGSTGTIYWIYWIVNWTIYWIHWIEPCTGWLVEPFTCQLGAQTLWYKWLDRCPMALSIQQSTEAYLHFQISIDRIIGDHMVKTWLIQQSSGGGVNFFDNMENLIGAKSNETGYFVFYILWHFKAWCVECTLYTYIWSNME